MNPDGTKVRFLFVVLNISTNSLLSWYSRNRSQVRSPHMFYSSEIDAKLAELVHFFRRTPHMKIALFPSHVNTANHLATSSPPSQTRITHGRQTQRQLTKVIRRPMPSTSDFVEKLYKYVLSCLGFLYSLPTRSSPSMLKDPSVPICRLLGSTRRLFCCNGMFMALIPPRLYPYLLGHEQDHQGCPSIQFCQFRQLNK